MIKLGIERFIDLLYTSTVSTCPKTMFEDIETKKKRVNFFIHGILHSIYARNSFLIKLLIL